MNPYDDWFSEEQIIFVGKLIKESYLGLKLEIFNNTFGVVSFTD